MNVFSKQAAKIYLTPSILDQSEEEKLCIWCVNNQDLFVCLFFIYENFAFVKTPTHTNIYIKLQIIIVSLLVPLSIFFSV